MLPIILDDGDAIHGHKHCDTRPVHTIIILEKDFEQSLCTPKKKYTPLYQILVHICTPFSRLELFFHPQPQGA